MLRAALKKDAMRRMRLQQWIVDLRGRPGCQSMLVAIANTRARMI
jgi:hypothetical protein